jgi:replicative DNA helicase
MLTGFDDLDLLTGGLLGGNLVFLASRPSIGKTSLAIAIASNVVRRDPETIYGADFGAREVRHAVAFFSLQSTRSQVVQKMIAQTGHLPVHDLRSGSVQAAHWPRLVRSVAEISRSPLLLNDSASLSLREMRNALEATRRGLSGTGIELGFVIVDYFQLMLPPTGSAVEREEHGTAILRGLKMLARDLDVPVLVLAQLGPDLERRHDKRPWLTDFGPFEPVEGFADMVMFLYRDEHYNPDSDDKGVAEVLVAKNRNGPTGRVQLAFHESWGMFASLARR